MSETRDRYFVRSSKIDLIMLILCCLFISFIQGGLWQVIPLLNGIIAFGVSFLILVICLSDSFVRKHFSYEQCGYGIVLILLLSGVYTIVMGILLTKSYFIHVYYCLVIMLIGAYVKNKPSFRHVLVGYIIFEIILKEIVIAFEMTIDPNIVRNAQFEMLSTNGVGIQRMVGVGVLYSIAILIFLCIANIQSLNRRLLLFAWLIFSVWTIVNASFTLIMFTTAIISFLIFFVESDKMEKNLFVIMLIIAGIIVSLQVFIDFAVSHKLFNETILSRLKDINTMFFAGNSGQSLIERYGNRSAITSTSSAQNRMVLYIQSGRAVLHNWLLGYLTPEAYIHGGHSTWLDLVAKYGILVLVYYKSIIDYQKRLFADSNSNQKKVIIAFALFYTILGIVNSFPMDYFYIQLYILVPYAYEMLPEPQKQREEAKP